MEDSSHVGTEHPLKRPPSPTSTPPTDKKPRSSNEAAPLSETAEDAKSDSSKIIENGAPDAVPVENEQIPCGGYDADPKSDDDGNADEDQAAESNEESADHGDGSDDDYDENVDAEEESGHGDEEMGSNASDSDNDDAMVDKGQSAEAQAEHRRGLGLRAAPAEVEHFGVPAAPVEDLPRSRGRPAGARTGAGLGVPAAVAKLGSSAKPSLRHFAFTNEQDLLACLLSNETGDRRALPLYTPTPRSKPPPPVGFANQLAWCTAWGASEDPARPVADDCCVCGLSDFEPGNDVLFCGDGAGSGCDGAFHQQCYGVAIVPEGDWYCRTCLAQAPEAPGSAAAAAAVADAASKTSVASPVKKAVASAQSDQNDPSDDDDDDFETSAPEGGDAAAESSKAAATANQEVDDDDAAAAAAAAAAAVVDAEWATTLQLGASVRGGDAIAEGAKLRALDLASAAAAEGGASEAEAFAAATASTTSNNGSSSAGPASEAAALDAMSHCHEFVSLCAFFDRFQWPAVSHGQLALALAPGAATARIEGSGNQGRNGGAGGEAVTAAAQTSSTFSAEFLGGIAASMLARVQGKPASAIPAEKWEAALGAALLYMDERDGAGEEEAETEGDVNDDGHDRKGKETGNGDKEGVDVTKELDAGSRGSDDAAWFTGLSVGSRVEVKLSEGEWVSGTVARLYKSTGRADIALPPAAGDDNDDDDDEMVADEERGVDRTKLRPPPASTGPSGAEASTETAAAADSSPPTEAKQAPLLLSMSPFDRARALSRLVDETLTFPPPDLLGALRTLAKEASDALRDSSLGFDRVGRGYYYLEDHVGGIFVVRTSPCKLPPLVAPLSTPSPDAPARAKADASAAETTKKAKGKSEATTAAGKGTGKSKGAKGGGGQGTFAWSAKAAKKKLAEEAAAAKAIAKSAADAVAAAAARRKELLASLEDDGGDVAGQNDGALTSGSVSGSGLLSGSNGGSTSKSGRSELLCFGEAGVQALIAALATTQDPSELWLWRNLSHEVLPRLAALAAERVRLEKKAERGQRRLAKANKELERLSSRMDDALNHGGGRSRGRGGKVDYTFSSYDRAMKDATRDW